jgi:hypothetical protein
VQPAPKKPHILDGLCSDDEDDDTEPEADNPVAAPLSKKEAIVKEALYWLVDREPSKPQANGQTALSMVAFWSKEDASARKGCRSAEAGGCARWRSVDLAVRHRTHQQKFQGGLDRRPSLCRESDGLRRFYFWKRGQVP